MSKTLLYPMLLLFALSPSVNAADYDQAEYDAVTKFLIDVTNYEGMAHSVFDYCGPKVSPAIAKFSKDSWQTSNQALLDARGPAEQIYLGMMDGPEQAAEAAARLESGLKAMFEKTRGNDRLYKDLVDEENLETACAKRLGAMNGSSFAFHAIAPESHAYFQERFAQ